MDSIPAIIQYFIGTIGATMSGIVYWLAIENVQPVQAERRKFQNLWLIAILCIFLSPLGAWVISSLIKVRRVAPTLKNSSD